MQLLPLRTNQSLDLPDVLVHMTGRAGPRRQEVPVSYTDQSPLVRLQNILSPRTLDFFPGFGNDWPVTCFAQVTRPALAGLIGDRYVDGKGIAFHKQAVFDAGGGPVLYVRGDEFAEWRGSVPTHRAARMVRYWPGLADPTVGNFPSEVVKESQWMMEREWRIPGAKAAGGGWTFRESDVAFLLLDKASDRTTLIDGLRTWRFDTQWVERLPVAVAERRSDGHPVYVGADDLWPNLRG